MISESLTDVRDEIVAAVQAASEGLSAYSVTNVQKGTYTDLAAPETHAQLICVGTQIWLVTISQAKVT